MPTFLIIGAQKSATRWLRANLGQHPDIYAARRELEFFDRRFDSGLAAYSAGFEGWAGERIVGEATPGYMIWRNDCERTAGRIASTLPDVRLLAILRNPIDRAYSAFLHHMVRGRVPAGADLLETVRSTPPERDPLSLISGGWYGASLEPYVDRFGPALLVLLQDDLRDGSGSLYGRALEHVGADPTFVPTDIDTVRFSSEPQLPKDASMLDGTGRRRPLRRDERAVLYDYFAEDIARLERLLGLDLARWGVVE